jgi:coiled-coil domain-containing protein 55
VSSFQLLKFIRFSIKFDSKFLRYGLILSNNKTAASSSTLSKPITAKKTPLVKPCIFDDEEDLVESDDDDTLTNKASKKAPSLTSSFTNTNSNRIKKETQIEIEKALKENPNVFEYDEIYDELEAQKAKLDPKSKNQNETKEPKYIAGLMKAAAKRRMENEKVLERKIQKERELEGELWRDKEVFVTTAYRKKMEERQALEQEERNQERIEELLDVRKQKDLSGFYDSLLKMKSGELVIEEEGEKQKRLERERAELEAKNKEKSASAQQKHFRSKNEEESSEEEADEESQDKQEDTNETSIKEEPSENDKIEQNEINKDAEFKEPLPKKIKTEDEANIENFDEQQHEQKTKPPKMSKEEARKLRLKEIFTKRTVGEKFEQELNDYFIRKANHVNKSYIERE